MTRLGWMSLACLMGCQGDDKGTETGQVGLDTNDPDAVCLATLLEIDLERRNGCSLSPHVQCGVY